MNNTLYHGAALTLRIVATSVLVFTCYFVIGLQLAIVPTFVHLRLGYNPLVAGLAISIQYVATLLSRPAAGHMADRLGGKFTAFFGLVTLVISSLVFIASAKALTHPAISLGALLVSRLFLGVGESCSATGSTLWGIGRTGPEHTALVISWSGVASYGALAVGAPTGVWLVNELGPASVGIVGFVVIMLGLFWNLAMGPAPVSRGEGVSLGQVFTKVLPYGLSLALGGVGFGTIASFITLYYASMHWQQSAYALSAFSISFVATRLLFAKTIDRYGGYRVAIASLTVQTIGLVILWLAPNPALALTGSAISGFGFSLVFPALGVEAVNRFPIHDRGSALGFYTAFIDLSLGISGPVAGFIVVRSGYSGIFPFAAALSLIGFLIAFVLYRNDLLCEGR
jgi:MFS family permease